MAERGFGRKLPWLLLLLLIPGAVGTVIVRRAIRGKSSDEAAHGGAAARRDRRQLRNATTPESEEAGTPASDEALVSAKEPVQEADEPEGDGGELAVFSKKGTKPVKFGKLPWTPGLAWKVETYYKNLQHPERAEWSPKPIVWQFTVRGAEKLDGVAQKLPAGGGESAGWLDDSTFQVALVGQKGDLGRLIFKSKTLVGKDLREEIDRTLSGVARLVSTSLELQQLARG